jgi:hypothetical protein
MRPVLWTAALLGGCALAPSSGVPSDLDDLPWAGGAGDVAVLEARRAADLGDHGRAFELLDGVIEAHPRHVDAHRVRQDLLRERGRLGLVLREAEQRLRSWNGEAAAGYLAGRIARDDSAKQRAFVAALEQNRRSFWPWLGLAFAYRHADPERALHIYQGLYEASRGHPLVAVAYGAALRAAGRDREALQVYGALRERPELPGVGDLGLAETHLTLERRREAWAPLLESLRRRPWDPGVRRIVEFLLGQGLPRAHVEQLLDVLWEDPERAAQLRDRGGASLLSALLERTGAIPAALEELRATLGNASAAVHRHERRLTLASGDVRGFLDRLGASRPEVLLLDESNQVRGVWLALVHGSWRDAADPLAEPSEALDLSRALVDAGLLVEAELLASLGIARHAAAAATADSLRALRDEVRREIAFEGALRRMIYSGYGSEPRGLDAFLDDVRRVSTEILGRDVVGSPASFEVPLVGRLVDPFGPGLAEHLRRYNKHLVLGQRAGGPPEGMLLTRVSVRYLDEGGPLPLPGRSWEVVGEDREIESIQGMLGGDLAGVALLNHYVVDLDAVRDWAGTLLERRRIVREDGMALLADPVPGGVDPMDPVDVAWRLGSLSSVQDSGLLVAVLDMIRWHERAHLCDSFRYLPPERNLWRVLGLVLGHGFSPASIEAEMEGRAETAALAFSPYTRLVLAHVAGFLEERVPGSPHGTGFARLARRLNDKLRADPALADRALVSRWHEIPVEDVRRLAEELARELWP